MKAKLLLFLSFFLISCMKEPDGPVSEMPDCGSLIFSTGGAFSTKASKISQLPVTLCFSAYLSSGALSLDEVLPSFAYDEACNRVNDSLYVSVNHFPPVDFNTVGKARFYLYGPASATGLTLSPSNVTGPPYLDYALPEDMSLHTDIVAGRSEEYRKEDFRSGTSVKYGRLTTVKADMTHILSCISVRTDSDGISSATLRYVTIRGAYSSGRYSFSEGTWSGLSRTSISFSQDADIELDGKPYQPILCPENGNAFMMIPQTLPSDAVIEIGLTDAAGDRVCTASIGGNVWAAGFDAVYSLHLDKPDGNIEINPFEQGGEQDETL